MSLTWILKFWQHLVDERGEIWQNKHSSGMLIMEEHIMYILQYIPSRMQGASCKKCKKENIPPQNPANQKVAMVQPPHLKA